MKNERVINKKPPKKRLFWGIAGGIVIILFLIGFHSHPTAVKNEAPLTDQELIYVRGMIDEFYGADSPNVEGIPSIHHIENVVKTWIENDLTNKIKSDFEEGLTDIKNTVGAQEGVLADVKDDVSTIKSEVSTFSDQIAEQVSIEVSKAVEPVVDEIFKTFIAEFKPVVSDFINSFEDVFPNQASLRVGCFEIQFNDITTTELNSMKVALNKASDDIQSVLDALSGEILVGIDCSADIPVLGEKSLGVEIESYWTLDDFKTWWADNKKLFDNL